MQTSDQLEVGYSNVISDYTAITFQTIIGPTH